MMRTKGRIRAADKAGITFRNSVRDVAGRVKPFARPDISRDTDPGTLIVAASAA